MNVSNEDVRRWIQAGLIDDDAGGRILSFEQKRACERQAPDRPGPVELLIYLATAVTTAGAAVLVATNWEHLGSAPRIAIPAVSAAVLLLAGNWLRLPSDPALRRGASLVWLLAGALVVATVAVAAVEGGASENDAALSAGLAALVASVALWRVMPMHPQIVGIGGAEFLFATAASSRFDEDWTVTVLGFVLALFGLAGLVAAEFGALVPRPSARILAGLGLAAGALWAGVPPGPPMAELFALPVLAVLAAAGVRFQSLVYVAFGVLTAFAALLMLILRHVSNPTIAGLALILIGLVLLLSIAGLHRFQPWARAKSYSSASA